MIKSETGLSLIDAAAAATAAAAAAHDSERRRSRNVGKKLRCMSYLIVYMTLCLMSNTIIMWSSVMRSKERLKKKKKRRLR